MAAAGWYYDPSEETPDGATNAWDAGDDPMEEHRQRSEDCLFFEYSFTIFTSVLTIIFTSHLVWYVSLANDFLQPSHPSAISTNSTADVRTILR
jgi:hypothetical protein